MRQSLRQIRTGRARIAPLAASLVVAALFLVAHPHDNDLLAAMARESATRHGVGLTYWFSWFAGASVPGQYSLLANYASVAVGVLVAAASAPVLVTALSYRATRGLAHALTTVWVATTVAWLNIWSGRVAFGLGCVALVGVCIGVRERRCVVTAVAAVLAAALSPVTGAFVVLGTACVALADGPRRRTALPAGALAAVVLLLVAYLFGQPGTQPFSVASSLLTAGVMAAFLLARPVNVVRVIVVVAMFATVAAALIPNGVGGNAQRMAWVCLPPLVVAGATASRRVLVASVLPALAYASVSTVGGMIDSRQPAQQYAFYASLSRRLDQIPGLANYRLEVVQDGSVHMNAYALLSHAAMARGWETQVDRRYDAVLLSADRLDPASYRRWLDDNAVGYVAFARKTAHPDPEHDLVGTAHLEYLQQIWGDADWLLYKVAEPTPIVQGPNHVVSASQAVMSIETSCACTFRVRVHFSRFLVADAAQGRRAATVHRAGEWTAVTTPQPGVYRLHGDLLAGIG